MQCVQKVCSNVYMYYKAVLKLRFWADNIKYIFFFFVKLRVEFLSYYLIFFKNHISPKRVQILSQEDKVFIRKQMCTTLLKYLQNSMVFKWNDRYNRLCNHIEDFCRQRSVWLHKSQMILKGETDDLDDLDDFVMNIGITKFDQEVNLTESMTFKKKFKFKKWNLPFKVTSHMCQNKDLFIKNGTV